MIKRRSTKPHFLLPFAFILFLTSSPLLTSKAHAQDGWQFAPYWRIDAGYSLTVNHNGTLSDATNNYMTDISPHTGGRLQVGLGAKLSAFLRTDVTMSFRDDLARTNTVRFPSGTVRSTSNGDHQASNTTTLLNVYIDPLTAIGMDTGAFSPYLQGGVGWARNKTTTMKFTNLTIDGATHNDVAWQIGAGLNYALSDQWKIDFSYRFLDMGQARSSKNAISGVTPTRLRHETRFDLQAHEILLGLQYQF